MQWYKYQFSRLLVRRRRWASTKMEVRHLLLQHCMLFFFFSARPLTAVSSGHQARMPTSQLVVRHVGSSGTQAGAGGCITSPPACAAALILH